VAFSSLSDGAIYKLLAHDEASSGVTYESWYAGDFAVVQRGEAYWVFVRSTEVYTAAPANATAPMTTASP
jgi:hypothetical protein